MPAHERLSQNPEMHESLPSKERYIFHCKAITISGRPGSGQSTTGNLLAERLGIRQHDIGRINFREDGNVEIIDYYDRPKEKDESVDNLQKEELRNATPENPVLLVSRLAGILTDEAKVENVVNVFVNCPRDTRYHRIWEREKERGNENITLKEVIENTQHREQFDIKQFSAVHPQIAYIYPYDPDAKNEDGKRIYDIVISSAENTKEEVVNDIINRLLESGQITKVDPKNCNNQNPKDKTTFEAN
jgi:cytidylate kinase